MTGLTALERLAVEAAVFAPVLSAESWHFQPLLDAARTVVAEREAHRSALAAVRTVIENIDNDEWEQAQADRHPLWEALDHIDDIVQTALSGAAPAPTPGEATTP